MNAALQFPRGLLILAASPAMSLSSDYHSGKVFHTAATLIGQLAQAIAGCEDLNQAIYDFDPQASRECISEQIALSISFEHPLLNQCLAVYNTIKNTNDEILSGSNLNPLIVVDLLTIHQKGLPESISPASLVQGAELRDVKTLINLPHFDFEDAVARLLGHDRKVHWLQTLVNHGDVQLQRQIKQRVGNLLCQSWGDDVVLLRNVLGLGDSMGLWEASARFTNAFELACAPVLYSMEDDTSEPWRRESTSKIEKQLLALESCHDYFRSMGVFDWQKLSSRFFANISANKFKPMPSATQMSDYIRVIGVGFERIPNAKQIMSLCFENKLSAGSTLCPMSWDSSFAHQLLKKIVSKAKVINRRKPHCPVEPSLRCPETTYASALLAMCTDAELIECSPESWQRILVARITDNTAVRDSLDDQSRVKLLSLDLGL